MRRTVTLFILSGLMPIAVLGGSYGILSLRQQRTSLEQRAKIESEFLARLVERDLVAHGRSIRMIAKSPAFDGGLDKSRFRLLASRLIEGEPSWRAISVSDVQGRRLIDVPTPIGGVANGRVVEMGSLVRAVQSGEPVIGNAVRGRLGTFAFPVRAPVKRDGKVVYVVSAVVPASAIEALLLKEGLPSGWRVETRDSAGTSVASAGKADIVPVREFSAPVRGPNWLVRVSVPDAEFTVLADQAQTIFYVGLGIGLLLFGAFSVLLLREVRAGRARTHLTAQSQKLEALGQLTGGVAHDLNNLLTPVLGGLDLLRRRVSEDEKALRYISNAMASAERARNLVGRLLAFSRRQPLEPEHIEISQLFDDIADLLRQSAGPACILSMGVEPGLPPIFADRHQLEMALMNLVVNARDAMVGGGSIQVRAARSSSAPDASRRSGEYLAISVQDGGTGMDEATLRRAIEPFFTTKNVDKGTGLGLSMVHGFALQSGGLLHLKSAPGIGTTATLVLPVGRHSANRPREESVAELPRRAALHILLVDDDGDVRGTIAAMLSENGHVVEEAGSVADACQLLSRPPRFDLVITDYLMPGGNGSELIAFLRSEDMATPILLVTGFSDDTDAVAKSVPHLRKPFTNAALLEKMEACLTEPSLPQ